MTTTRNENGETDNDNEGAERWCSTCEHHAEDCTCNPDGDETVAEYEAAQAAANFGRPAQIVQTRDGLADLREQDHQAAKATAAPATETLAAKFERLDQDGAFTGNPKYNAALKRLADTRLDDEELKRLYGSKWEAHR